MTELRELDAEIAYHVFGWRWFRSKRDGMCTLQPPEGNGWHRSPWGPTAFDAVAGGAYETPEKNASRFTFGLPRYSTDPAAALAALETWPGDFSLRRQNGIAWKCVLYRPSEEFEAWESSLPLAVCRALLKAHTEGKV